MEHMARRGGSVENSLAWSVVGKPSGGVPRGAALIDVLCDGTASKVLIAASVSNNDSNDWPSYDESCTGVQTTAHWNVALHRRDVDGP